MGLFSHLGRQGKELIKQIFDFFGAVDVPYSYDMCIIVHILLMCIPRMMCIFLYTSPDVRSTVILNGLRSLISINFLVDTLPSSCFFRRRAQNVTRGRFEIARKPAVQSTAQLAFFESIRLSPVVICQGVDMFDFLLF